MRLPPNLLLWHHSEVSSSLRCFCVKFHQQQVGGPHQFLLLPMNSPSLSSIWFQPSRAPLIWRPAFSGLFVKWPSSTTSVPPFFSSKYTDVQVSANALPSLSSGVPM